MEASSTPKMKITFKDQHHDELHFGIKRSTKVMRLLRAYCAKMQLDYSAAVFFHDGDRLQRKGTVEQAGLKDGDQIDVTVHCNGGGGPQINV